MDKIAHNEDEKRLLAKLWDKINAGMQKNIPASTCFLTPYEQSLAQLLFGDTEGLTFFGGYPEAERKLLCYLPDYLDGEALNGESSPIACLHAEFFAGDSPDHRSFLGALMGLGIARESVGDICVGKGSCDFFVKEEIAPFVLQELSGAGRTRLRLSRIPLDRLLLPEQKTVTIKDTLASLRLDALVSSGFRIGRGQAAQLVAAGKAAVNGIPCDKADKAVRTGDKVSVRGLGKILLESVNGQSKKGRFCVVIQKYL